MVPLWGHDRNQPIEKWKADAAGRPRQALGFFVGQRLLAGNGEELRHPIGVAIRPERNTGGKCSLYSYRTFIPHHPRASKPAGGMFLRMAACLTERTVPSRQEESRFWCASHVVPRR